MTRWVAAGLMSLALVGGVAAALMVGVRGGGGPAAALAADPADPAMVFSDDRPCVAPCARTGLVYGSAGSALDPGAPPKSLALDLYRSAKTPKAGAPVIVLLHGGGFVTGDRTQMRVLGEALAKAGFLVASIDYRLAPAARNRGAGIVKEADLIPASAEAEADAERAMRWVRAHARTLGATTDRQRYAVGGYSAGAIAALRVGVRGGDRSTPRNRRWRVGAAFAIAGTECGSWTRSLGCKPAYDRSDPPLLMFHGTADSIVSFDWGRDTCTSAVLRGGGCTGYFYRDKDHFWSSGTVFGGADDLTKRSPAVAPTIAAFLRKTLTE